MNRSRKTTTWATMAVLASALLSAGCGMNRRYANREIHQLAHSNVEIQYSWHDSGGEQQASMPPSDSGPQTISIIYPHPSPKYGRKYAEVTLRHGAEKDESEAAKVVNQLVTNPFKQQEAKAAKDQPKNDGAIRLIIAREELEFLLRDLVADSFFDREARTGGVNVSVKLDSRTTHKQWDHVASFEQLAQRVQTENDKRMKKPARAVKPPAVPAELLAPTVDEPGDEVSPVADSPRKMPDTVRF